MELCRLAFGDLRPFEVQAVELCLANLVLLFQSREVEAGEVNFMTKVGCRAGVARLFGIAQQAGLCCQLSGQRLDLFVGLGVAGDEFARQRVHDLFRLGPGLVFETDGDTDGRGNYHRDQHAGLGEHRHLL